MYNPESTPLNTFTLDVLNTIKDGLKIPLKDNFIDRSLLLQILEQIVSNTNFGNSDIEHKILLFFTEQAAKLIKTNPELNLVLLGSNHNIFYAFGQHIRKKHINHESIKVLFGENTIFFNEIGELTGNEKSLNAFGQKLYLAKNESFFSL